MTLEIKWSAFPSGGDILSTDQLVGLRSGVNVKLNALNIIFDWNVVTSGPQAILANNGYIANSGSLLTFTLPTSCPAGATFTIVGKGAGGWKITQASGQFIHVGNKVTTTGLAGYVSSTNQYDCITVTCVTTDLEFTSYALQGLLDVE